MLRLHNVTRITADGVVPHSTIDIENGKIIAVYDALLPPSSDVTVYDANGAFAAPSFAISRTFIPAVPWYTVKTPTARTAQTHLQVQRCRQHFAYYRCVATRRGRFARRHGAHLKRHR